jgi:Ser/Thr protein kinase RdoA (MazF antagonist)
MTLTLTRPDWGNFKAALGREMPGIEVTRIRKLEVTKEGELLAQLHAGARPLWLRWNGERIEELRPATDERIALTALLREGETDGAFEILNYRPGRRLVLLDRRRTKPQVIKGFRKGRAAPAFKRYETAYRAFSGRSLRAPEVIDLDETTESLILVYEQGMPLDSSPGSMDIYYHIGESLADFQGRTTDIEAQPFGSRDELNVIDGFVVKVAAVGLELPMNWEALRARLGAAEATLPAMSAGLCHRDLYDKQFTFNADYLTLFDFDLMCHADVTLDPANFLAHMVLRKLQGVAGASEDGIDLCGKQFLEGLGRNAEPGFWERLRFYQASSFCRLALVYTLRPRWATMTPLLVRMGQRCLDDLRRIQGR